MLCQICIGALQYRENIIAREIKGMTYGHHRTVETLALSAQQGCQICSRTWEHFFDAEPLVYIDKKIEKHIGGTDEEEGSVWFTAMRLLLFAVLPENHDRYYLSCYLWGDYPTGHSLELRSTSFVLEPRQVPSVQSVNGTISNNTGSNESWSLVVNWMKNCLESHPRCHNTRSWYPTRLLDAGDPTSDGSDVRLVISASEPLSGRYCTLSHCWGQGPLIQLTSATMQSLCAGFALDQMPKTFREAILVTKRLGIRYIWIDSLCIKQDDLLDWRREAGQMHRVYSNTFCNISAAASADSTQGLFRDRLPHTTHVSVVNLCPDSLDLDHDFVRCEVHDECPSERHISESVLNMRGWVLQERLLAPRVLHFSHNQLFWECCEHEACETYPKGFGLVFPSRRMGTKALVPDFRRTANIGTDHRVIAHWPRIVEAYSGTSLTVSSDKLVALSGLANIFRAISNDEYVAGMWRSRLEQMLMWFVPFDHDRSAVRPTRYRAPTWSWASLDKRIAMSGRALTKSPTNMFVRQVHLEFVTEDTTGAIKSGWLDLTGCLKPMRLVREGLKEDWAVVLGDMAGDASIDVSANYDDAGQSVKLDIAPSDDDIIHADNAAHRLYFMVDKDVIDKISSMDILLLRLVDEKEKVFERIGIAWSKYENVAEYFLADLGEDVRMKLPCRSYENGLHTVRII
ncbi:heterokaryon incompatibility protein-domain-containing protein [Paraphoma chrysanthemicola]|uniref:Heterokaryon incompatibility protein-domain-containing protein n=1 Tax=Paraphoma chrysanthemicola TaxID=798071 RepID=A0A8K0VYG3_9PLEO|nr:heterokaryon incompatibility protein-domain-containing protein [Paraphoma chrysanthemicola]